MRLGPWALRGRRSVHQVLGVYAARDAVGHHTLVLRDALRRRGYQSEIFADDRTQASRNDIRPIGELERRGRDDLLVYQASTYTPVAELVADRPERLVVNYHNITPAAFFQGWEPQVAASLADARRQVAGLAAQAALAIADSAYNAADLVDWGYARVEVVPCLIDTDRLAGGGPNPWPAAAGTKWLFVGRIAPNKAQHEIVKAFKVYREVYDNHAVLALPGRSSSHSYSGAVDRFVRELGLDDAVLRPGSVPDHDLGAYYRSADVFVCLSRHEGFCNTVVEAMAAGVPVVASASAALPTTIGDAGLLLPEWATPLAVAAAVRCVVANRRLAKRFIACGHRRHAELSLTGTVDRLGDVIERELLRR